MDNPVMLCKTTTEYLLTSDISRNESYFKDLVASVENVMLSSCTCVRSKKADWLKSPLLFQFSQLASALRLLLEIFKCEDDVHFALRNCRDSIYKRLNICLDLVLELLNSDVKPKEETGCFLKWMDKALEKIAEVDLEESKKKFEIAKTCFGDVLAHSMSIAQICLEDDAKAIKGGCHAVLECLNDLEREIGKPEANRDMVGLFVDSCGDKLCALERKVDIAILRLSLKVFSIYLTPLEEVFLFVENHFDDEVEQVLIDDVVADFDLHVDRIIQIGLFAVYCSSSIVNGIKIRSCIASLEYMETELIPTALILMMDNSMPSNSVATLYKNYWKEEAKQLKKLIFDIIDPTTYCEVIYEEVRAECDVIFEEYKNDVRRGREGFTTIWLYANVYTEFVICATSLPDAGLDRTRRWRISSCRAAMRELRAALYMLRPDCLSDIYERVLKRCKVLKAELKKLLIFFQSLGTPKQKEDSQSETPKDDLTENKFFKQVMEKGKDMFQSRSILYKNLNKSIDPEPVSKGKREYSVEYYRRKLSSKKLDFSFNAKKGIGNLNSTMGTILDEVTRLSKYDPWEGRDTLFNLEMPDDYML